MRLPVDGELGPYLPTLARLVLEWRQPVAPGYPESMIELLLRLLAVLGRDAGCALLLEDLHDADSETLGVVDYLLDNLAGLPVVLVGTLRPAPGPALRLVHAAERRRATSTTTLRPLDTAEIREIAAGCLEIAPEEVPDALLARLADGGDGNPYLDEELLADLVGSGAASGCGWSPRPPSPTAGAIRWPGSAGPRSTFTRSTSSRWRVPAGRCCGGRARVSGNGAAGAIKSRSICGRVGDDGT